MRLPILSLLLLLPRAARPDAALFTNPAPIQVTAPRAAPAAGTAGWDTAAWLERVPLVSVRQQGLGGAQGDLSVRGGAFNTSGLLLQGVALRNPQTEHFHGDLDVPGDTFTLPAVSTGLDRFARTASHPAGAVVLDLAPVETGGRLAFGVGGEDQRQFQWQQGASVPGRPDLRLSAFAGWEAVDRTDRQPDNNLRRWSAGGRGQAEAGDGMIDLLAGTSQRAFGARGFYGTPVSLPSDEQIRNTLALASYRRGDRTAHDFDGLAAAVNQVEDTTGTKAGRRGAPAHTAATCSRCRANGHGA